MTQNKAYYLSPSSLNLFLDEPALWIIKQFYGLRTEASIHAYRGKLIENVVNHWYETGKITTRQDFEEDFCNECFDFVETWDGETLGKVYDWSLHAVKAFKELVHERPIGQQEQVFTEIEGLKVGGFIDYEYEKRTIDLKTVGKLPVVVSRGDRKGLISKTKAAHVRQQLIYAIAKDKPAALLYVDGAGDSLLYDIGDRDMEEQYPIILDTVKIIKNLLPLSKEDVIKEVEPKNMNHFFWDTATYKLAKQLWKV